MNTGYILKSWRLCYCFLYNRRFIQYKYKNHVIFINYSDYNLFFWLVENFWNEFLYLLMQFWNNIFDREKGILTFNCWKLKGYFYVMPSLFSFLKFLFYPPFIIINDMCSQWLWCVCFINDLQFNKHTCIYTHTHMLLYIVWNHMLY